MSRVLRFVLVEILLLILLMAFALDFYKVPTSSMQPTIEPGSYIVIDDIANNFRNYSTLHKFTFETPHKNEVYVFYKPNWGIKTNKDHSFWGDILVKRCFGLQGDTVIISKPKLSEVSGYASRVKYTSFDLTIFPHDSTFNWSYNKFGPLWIPKKGHSILLNERNKKVYGQIIAYESPDVLINKKSIYLNRRGTKEYIFKHDYYFMLGDNFYASDDSRIWGLVPEENLIGPVLLIL